MSPTRARAVLTEWRQKADDFEKMATVFMKAHMKSNADTHKAMALIYRNCADAIDREFGRLS